MIFLPNSFDTKDVKIQVEPTSNTMSSPSTKSNPFFLFELPRMITIDFPRTLLKYLHKSNN